MKSSLAMFFAAGSIFAAGFEQLPDNACSGQSAEDVREEQNIAGSAALLQVSSRSSGDAANLADVNLDDEVEVKSVSAVIADKTKTPDATQLQDLTKNDSTKTDPKPVAFLEESLASSAEKPSRTHHRASFVAAENTHRSKGRDKHSSAHKKQYPEEYMDEWKTIMVYGSIVLPLFLLVCGSPFGASELGSIGSEAIAKNDGH